MPSQEDIARQQQILAAHRASLSHYLIQRAQLGPAYAPPVVHGGIAEARVEIARCKAILAGWGVAVEDHPDDDERAADPPRKPAAPSRDVQPAAVLLLRDPAPDFVGREPQIEQLVRALSRAAARGKVAAISSVRGMGGVGKTELALAVAQRLAPLFPDGQALVDLRSAAAPLPSAFALQLILRAFDPSADAPSELSSLQEAYRAALAGKRALILADNAWDAAQVRPLLPPAGCALLITTRQRFILPGMTIVDLRILPEDDAVRLLRTICPRIGVHAAALARLCGYLPLALRVSASLLANDDTLRVERYLARLADERTRLANLRDPDDPDLDVEASLHLSYDALDAPAQRMLCHLSVFPTSFTLAAAQAVVDDGGAVEARLSQLRRRSMIEWDEAAGRYSLHDLVRVFAAERLGEQSAVLQQRALAWGVQEMALSLTDLTDLDAQAQVRQHYQADLEYLWHLLADDLRKVAGMWILSGMAADVETLALALFADILMALPQVRLDQQPDLRAHLLTVAWSGAYAASRLDAAPFPPPGWREAPGAAPPPDPGAAPLGHAHAVAANSDQQRLTQIIWDYWRATLSNEDFQIAGLRVQSDSPRSFESIAAQLGPGWTAQAVQQRHDQVLAQTRRYLQERGLLDAADPSSQAGADGPNSEEA